jgi:hypothetical protein
MALGRQSLAEALSSPCPETTAASPSPVSQESLNQLKTLFPNLASPTTSTPKPGKRWEKSGKLPGKTTLDGNKTKQNHKDRSLSKIFPKDPKTVIEELAGGRLDIATLNAIGAGRSLPEPLAIFQDAGSPQITDPLGKVF